MSNVPRTADIDDREAHIRWFLALAKPILDAQPELDEAGWEQLCALARQTAVTDTELQTIVRQLYRRGVLRRLPHFFAHTIADDRQEGFAASAGGATTPPPFPTPAGPIADGSSAAGQLPHIADFIWRARSVLAAYGRIDARVYALLTHLAHELGLSEQQFDAAMDSLSPQSSRRELGQGVSQATGAAISQPRAPVHSTAEPPPLTLPVGHGKVSRPAETFRQYLQLALSDKKQHRGFLSPRAARKIVAQGVEKLGLSPVYARQLVEEEAERLKLPVMRDQADSIGNVEEGPLALFLERALPILSQQRGLTPQAQILLTALADELGLSEAQWRAALEAVPTERLAASQTYQQRVAAFEQHLRDLLKRQAGKILSPPETEALRWQAVQLFGLTDTTAQQVLEETAHRFGVLVLDPHQARQFLRLHIQNLMAGASRLDPDRHLELLSLGQQWGVPSDEIRRIIVHCAAENRRRARRRTALLVTALLLPVGISLSLLVGAHRSAWFARPVVSPASSPASGIDRTPHNTTAVSGTNPRSSDEPIDGQAPPTPSLDWWSEEAEKLWVICRRELGEAGVADLGRLKSADANDRRKAYEALVAQAVGPAAAKQAIQPLGQLLAFCAARDDDPAARDYLWSLLEQVVTDDRYNMATDPPAWQFQAGLPILLAAVDKVVGAADRAELISRLNRLLEMSVPASGTFELRLRPVFQRAVAMWAERLAVRATTWPPPRSWNAWLSLQPAIVEYLTPEESRRLLVAFCRHAVPVAGADWSLYKPALEELLRNSDRETMLEFVRIAARATDEQLKRYLLEEVLRRSGETPTPLTPLDQLLALARSKLGVEETKEETWSERALRWQADVKYATASGLPSSQIPRLCEQIAELSRLHLQGLAIWKQHYTAWQYAAAPRYRSLEEDSEESSVLRDAVTLESLPMVQEAVRGVHELRRARSSTDRVTIVKLLAQMAPSVPDIPPQQAEILAGCLLEMQSDRERREVFPVLHRFDHWNNLRLALAFALGRPSSNPAQWQPILEAIYGRKFTGGDGQQTPADVRLQLVDESIAALAVRVAERAKNSPLPLARLQRTLATHWHYRRYTVLADPRPIEPLSDPHQATDTLRAAVLAVYEKLPPEETLEHSFRERRRHIASQVPLIDVASLHDFERAVRWEQIWLEILAMEVDRSSRSERGLQRVHQTRDQLGSNLLQQLFYTELACLDLLTVLINEVK